MTKSQYRIDTFLSVVMTDLIPKLKIQYFS